MSGGGDSEGIGTSAATKMLLGSSEASTPVTGTDADCGASTTGLIGGGDHVEQHMETRPQSSAGVSSHPS